MRKRRAGRPGKSVIRCERTGANAVYRGIASHCGPATSGTSFVLRGLLGFAPLLLSSDQPWRVGFSLVGIVFGIVWNGVVGRPNVATLKRVGVCTIWVKTRSGWI